jgi:demethylmenaquinone methyltransferase/2-methoxy-6-polyprenyl-1,4-benzoquinol methylase
MTDTGDYLQKLLEADVYREPVLRRVIKALQLPSGSQGLDAGCGVGLQALLLAEAVGPGGRVTGIDITPEFIDCARGLAERSALGVRLSFRVGDVNELPFDDGAFDWAWSVDCVGYGGAEALSQVRELMRVVRPGGIVALVIWSSQQLLPGYPFLEARLNATAAGIAPFTRGMRPGSHYYRGLGLLRAAGLEELAARAFAGSVHAPLSEEMRAALAALLDMRWGTAEGEMTAEDWALYQRLARPDSSDCILDLPDYYAFFTYSLFQGRVVG